MSSPGNRFLVCPACQRIRALDHMAKSGRCVFCPAANAPRLLPPPAPMKVTHWAIKESSDDAVEKYLRQKEARR